MDIDFRKIMLILKKDWSQLRQQRGLVLSAIFLPVVLTIVPLAVIVGLGQAPPDSFHGIDQLLNITQFYPSLQGRPIQEILQAAVGQPISTIMLLLPVILPSIIASYSIVGEKVGGTLEPLLATPITSLELLLAKILTAFIPAVGLTWLFGVFFVIALFFLTLSSAVFTAIISPSWLILFLLCGPLLSLTTVAATVAASSKANDPRTAQQISAVVILPVFLVLGGQISGLLILNPVFSLLVALVLALLAAVATWIATRLFSRETILTRWS